MLTDVTKPLYGKVFHALEDRLRAAGYVVLLANSLNSAERKLEREAQTSRLPIKWTPRTRLCRSAGVTCRPRRSGRPALRQA